MLGWRKINTKFCQAVSYKNRIERLLFCRLCKVSREDFSNFIYEDETTIELRWNSRKKWHLKFSDENQKGHVERYSHNFKIHLLAGISKAGATRAFLFSGKLI